MNEHYPFVNLPLPYPYHALEPYIDETTMRLHHDKHLQTYIDNLNHALTPYTNLHTLSLEQLLQNIKILPAEIQISVKNNAGGVWNHQFYFTNLTASNNFSPSDLLSEYINLTFGSDTKFREQLKKAALSVFGSGYAWLVVDRNGVLQIVTTENQDTPLTEYLYPVLNLDVWEHAYYLKHYNARDKYIDNWFHVVDWKQANNTYKQCFRKYRIS